jgi:hypothetical protein
MNIESFAGINAATPLTQSKGTDADRAVHEISIHKEKTTSDTRADEAAGIGQTDGDQHEIEEREADGRMPWQWPDGQPNDSKSESTKTSPSRDATGQCGNLLDLTG